MPSRREVIKALAAGAALLPLVSAPVRAALAPGGWLTGYGGDAGSDFGVARIAADLRVTPLFISSQRLHSILKHPRRAEFCAPARRPGTELLVWRDGAAPRSLPAAEGRHFYGHGAFSADGRVLFATENDYDGEHGVIGLYDAENGYRRLGEIASGGIGPHQMHLHPDGRHLLVANGGLLTHPATGRAVLNLGALSPCLSLIDPAGGGTVVAEARLPDEQSHMSIRHFDVTADGTVVFGMQAQGAATGHPPLVATWRPGAAPRPLPAPTGGWPAFAGYVGGLALDRSGRITAATSPRGGLAAFWDLAAGTLLGTFAAADICGIAATGSDRQFLLTTGTGVLVTLDLGPAGPRVRHRQRVDMKFDNHCREV